ncbi:portal protein [Rahnella bonaserana]
MEANAQQLIRQGDYLFGKKSPILSLWQEIAEQFYPERADFTVCRSLGDEFADHLMTSYPVMARRDLGNSFSSMLRRDNWFSLKTSYDDNLDHDGRMWLDWARDVQRRAMYDKRSQFVRATKEGDHDYAAFGQCAISVEMNKNADGLLYRCWHLRDMAWQEGSEGTIDTVHRRWKPTVRDLKQIFGSKVHDKISGAQDSEQYRQVECRHVVLPADEYSSKYKTPFVSVFIDVENQHVMEETGVFNRMYVIPRWQTVSGSQYAYSPATIVALPDARLIQSITRVLLEAGEKAVDPPLVASREVFRDDFNLMAGGITWADIEMDTDIRNVISSFGQNSNLPAGINIRDDVRVMISQAFYLDKLTLPSVREMTAYETAQRVQEYIRQALPIFQPIEYDYNGDLCEMSFDLLLRGGAFGSAMDMPEALRGKDVQFTFDSPLQAAIGQEKQGLLQNTAQMLGIAAQIDPNTTADVDIRVAFRDAMDGFGVPTKWMRSVEDADQIIQQNAEQQQAQQAVQQVQQGADVMQNIAAASQAAEAIG